MFIDVGFNLSNGCFGFALSLELTAVSSSYDISYGVVASSTWKVTMFLRVAVLVFLFLARILFPKNESISSIVQKR